MPADAVREAVKAEIRAVTGLDPVLRGAASVSLFPTGTVSFDDVSLGDNRTGAPALTAERVVARLRFFPFLTGRIEIADVSLVRPTIAITFNADRSSNWSGHIETLARNLQAKPGRDVRRSRKSGSRTAPSSCATRPTRSSRRSRTWNSRSPGRRSRRASPPPAASPGTTSRSTPPSASPISSPRLQATGPGSRSGSPARRSNSHSTAIISHRPTLKMEGTLAADATSVARRAALGRASSPRRAAASAASRSRRKPTWSAATIGLSGVNVELDGNAGEGVLTFDGTADVARNAGGRGPRPDALRFDRPAADQRRARLGLANRSRSTASTASMSICACRPPASTSPMPSSGARRSPPTCAAATSRWRSANPRPSAAWSRVRSGSPSRRPAPTSRRNCNSPMSISSNVSARCSAFDNSRARAISASRSTVPARSVYDLTKALNGTAALTSRKGAIAGFNVEQLLRRIERRPLSRNPILAASRRFRQNGRISSAIRMSVVGSQKAPSSGIGSCASRRPVIPFGISTTPLPPYPSMHGT